MPPAGQPAVLATCGSSPDTKSQNPAFAVTIEEEIPKGRGILGEFFSSHLDDRPCLEIVMIGTFTLHAEPEIGRAVRRIGRIAEKPELPRLSLVPRLR